MARAQLATPENISGERSLGTPNVDMGVKAQPFSTFKQAVGTDIPDAPKDNTLMQLGSAMSRFNPALTNMFGEQAKETVKVDTAEARAAFEKTRVNYAKAVEDKLIPAGASRAYIAAYQSAELNTKGLKHSDAMHAAYEASGIKGSDDPDAYSKFVQKFNGDYRAGALMKEDKDQYTPLEIANSKFDEIIQGNTNSLSAQHTQFRVQARTELGKQIAQNQMAQQIKMNFESGNDASYVATANKLVSDAYDPLTSTYRNGLTLPELNKHWVDTIATAMIDAQDEDVAKIAEHIGMGPGSKLANWPYAKNKFKEAADAIMTDKIRHSNWDWDQRKKQAQEQGGFGPEAQGQRDAETAARTKEAWAHDDKMKGIAERQADRADMKGALGIRVDSHVSSILTGLKAGDMSNPRVHASLEWLKYNDPDKAMVMINFMESHKRAATAFHDTPASDMVAVQLRYQMSRNPLNFNSFDIVNAVEKKLLNPTKATALLDDWDKARIHQDNPFLQNPQFGRMVDSIRKLAVKDADDQYGPGAARAQNAEDALRRHAYAWIESNPKGNYLEFIKEMKTQSEAIGMDYAPEYAADEKKKADSKANPKPIPQKDTRSFLDKISGVEKPKPITPEAGPQPMKASEAMNALKPDMQSKIKKMLADPNTDEMDLDAAIGNSGLWAYMKSNGRSVAEYKALKDLIVSQRGKK